tara:strand:- start:60 stop:251 length:192 start_codon:yes stop_codon:yes gene_type:complete
VITYSGNKNSDNYKTKREKSYPALGEQFDLLYHAIDSGQFGDTAKSSNFYTKIKAVKDKYPKS